MVEINPKLLELYNNVNPKVESVTIEQLQELVRKLEGVNK